MTATHGSRAAIGLAAALVLLGVSADAHRVAGELDRAPSFAGASYVQSNACLTCHPGKHASWYRTFHRTMTQEASAAAVLGRFDGRTLAYGGYTARMERDREGRFHMRFASRDGAHAWSARVVRTVGSRRYQQYLARSGDTYVRLPVAWNVDEQRFMHMNGAFLTPDPEPDRAAGTIARADYERHVARWNDNCVYCHNVAPRPGLDPASGRFDTHVAELGIACEACHGPASEHVAQNRDPLRRFALHLGTRADPTIENPRRMSAERGAQVCGHCHGQRLSPEIERVHQEGDTFKPGEDLARYSRPLFRDTTLNGQPGAFEARFYADGTPRLTAYEYQGLLQSPCAQGGAFQCESCHRMHEGDPRGQLDPNKTGDALCTSCHTELRETAQSRAHSHHDPNGPGARCLECHMPRVVYGLIGAHRSHRIDVPQPDHTAGPPDACTLCHVDRTRAWAAEALAAFARDARPTPLAADVHASLPPEAARLLVAGDPIERAVAADALGRAHADAAGADVLPRLAFLLDAMEHDRYPAVRAIAFRALRSTLQRHFPRAAPSSNAFTATDSLEERRRALVAIRANLPALAQPAALPELAAQRANASEVEIFIGE